MLAVFGIESSEVNLAVYVLVFCLALVWLTLVWWTRSDARLRIDDSALVACATAASLLLPFLGTILYMIVRPPQYLDDVYEREVSIKSSQAVIKVLTELKEDQARLHASVERLEHGMMVNRQMAARLRAEAAGTPREPSQST